MTRADDFTPDNLRELVHTFYGAVQQDDALGPIFDRVIGRSAGGWPPHLERMTAFWCAVMLHQPGYDGNPRLAHARVHDLAPHHFVRWLELFEVAAAKIYTDDAAEFIAMRAHAMGANLSRAVLGV